MKSINHQTQKTVNFISKGPHPHLTNFCFFCESICHQFRFTSADGNFFLSMTNCRGSWVVGSWVEVVGRGSWVWVWVKVVDKSRGYQTIIHNQLSAICNLYFCVAISTFSYFFISLFLYLSSRVEHLPRGLVHTAHL